MSFVDDLLGDHYSAVILHRKDPVETMAALRAVMDDPSFKAKLADLEALANSVGKEALGQRCFISSFQLKALREAEKTS